MDEALGSCQFVHTEDSLLECMEGRHMGLALNPVDVGVPPKIVVKTPCALHLPESARLADRLALIADFFREQAILAMRASSE